MNIEKRICMEKIWKYNFCIYINGYGVIWMRMWGISLLLNE